MPARNPLNKHEPTLIFEKGAEGRYGTQVISGLRHMAGSAGFQPAESGRHDGGTAAARLPAQLLQADTVPLPQLDELDVSRHFVHLSHATFGIDTGFYPLGSCTMKYNPKSLERLMRITRVAHTHPAQPFTHMQGFLQLMYELQAWLAEISGFDAVSIQPAAGAQGEFAGMIIFRRYFEDRGETARNVMLVPDSAHGTNPASAVLAGFKVHEIACAPHGGIMTLDLLNDAIDKVGADNVAGIMLTNPSTLGTFEENIVAVSQRMKEIGALLYYDGANLNALVGIARPGDMGFDLMHYNTHKTFSTPHGGGGPGSGPIGVKAHLADYLPHPQVRKSGAGYEFFTPDKSIGRMKMFHGQFGMMLRCWGYILLHGPDGLLRNTEHAILNANYLQALIKDKLNVPYATKSGGAPRYSMHEFVASAGQLKREHGVTAKDIAKALLSEGFHAPTIYFPLIVEEALMVEPTETESMETLDRFAETLLRIVDQARHDAEELRRTPNLRVTHLDETHAARNLNVRWRPGQSTDPAPVEAAGTPTV